jgi:hypothetical protein
MAARRLQTGDWQGFALWFLVGISLLQVGGSLVEVASSAGASLGTATLINRLVLPHLQKSRRDRTGVLVPAGKTP